ncbi:potassium/sodium hyperpolarization-activated cyclic nucleotide-gated channel 1-like [Rhinichthys klamathensis goyatoka]|uniref:potassium/sodium hyperpolarization-activated cyclic nucleotide-gated channel 1-like n=1 Tax=Rhinichthys klamathensis goyatoka TaxID=3034132 RepID=UPI0024B507DD|nr:potassium/sodium hyperpolarization-activated cyclic nucleotide-gated channel 1-like [Rhinichthys klamathensis goyatoka]
MSENSVSGLAKTRLSLSELKDIETGRSMCNDEGETHRWVIHPRTHFRHYYLVYMVVLTFVNLITIPLDMAFSDDMHGSAHKYWVAFNVYSDLMFCVDVGLNFRMGIFSEDGQAILDPKLIRKDYFRSWFVPDVVAAFPVDIIIIIVEHVDHADTASLVASKLVRMLMFVRILSLIRLLRLPKLLRFCFELESVSDVQLEQGKKLFRVVFVFMMMILICHWNTCVHYFISVMEEFPADSWVVKEKIVNASIGEKYSYASFRAFSRMAWRSTDSPTRVDELWIAIVSMVIGIIMCSAFISCVITAFGSMSATGNAYKVKINQLQSSTNFQTLPRVLRQRITAQYKWQWDKENILDIMSKQLRKDIMAEICSNLLNKGMFLSFNEEFTEAILMKLDKEFFNADDIIIRQNAQPDNMFFIDYGRVLVKNEAFQMELCGGDHFGEISFLFGGRQLAKVSALTTCSLFTLSLQEFQELEKEFPHVVNELRGAAEKLKNDLESKPCVMICFVCTVIVRQGTCSVLSFVMAMTL